MKPKTMKTLVVLLGVLLSAVASAENKDGSNEPSFIAYKIKAGDTLNRIAHQYLVQPLDLDAIKKANRPQSLDILKVGAELSIPRHLVKTSPSKATIMGLSCATSIRVGNSSKALTVGTQVSEGALIEVPAECHVSLLLEDGSIIRLPSSAALKISTLRKNALETAPEVKLDLARGRVELDVNKGRSKLTPFEVRTPISIMGVRGTEFRVGYSPEDQAGQVEVLGGTVQTRGNTDANAQAITKGLGVPINADGKSLGVETLLDPPAFAVAKATAGSAPSFVVQLTAPPHASYFVADSSNTANLTGQRSSQHLLSPELFIPRLTPQLTFYLLTSVSETGLVGTERTYGFCTPLTDSKEARCSALFEAPLADGVAISFQLSKTINGVTHQLVDTQTLHARFGRFAIQGLPAGRYQWRMSYPLAEAPHASNSHPVIRQSGSFELITLPTPSP
jgi:hypothetical protein